MDALRVKVGNLEGELAASLATSSMLRQELERNKHNHSMEESRLREQVNTLRNRVRTLPVSRCVVFHTLNILYDCTVYKCMCMYMHM